MEWCGWCGVVGVGVEVESECSEGVRRGVEGVRGGE